MSARAYAYTGGTDSVITLYMVTETLPILAGASRTCFTAAYSDKPSKVGVSDRLAPGTRSAIATLLPSKTESYTFDSVPRQPTDTHTNDIDKTLYTTYLTGYTWHT